MEATHTAATAPCPSCTPTCYCEACCEALGDVYDAALAAACRDCRGTGRTEYDSTDRRGEHVTRERVCHCQAGDVADAAVERAEVYA